jgi:hypothetical protein
MNNEGTTADFRPYLSPKCPKTNPPIGLIRNAPPYTLNESIKLCDPSGAGGKNTTPMTSEK